MKGWWTWETGNHATQPFVLYYLPCLLLNSTFSSFPYTEIATAQTGTKPLVEGRIGLLTLTQSTRPNWH